MNIESVLHWTEPLLIKIRNPKLDYYEITSDFPNTDENENNSPHVDSMWL